MYSGEDNLEVMQYAKNYNTYLLSIIKLYLKTDDNIVDFGSGIGTFAKPLTKDGFKIICVEIDNLFIDNLKQDGLVVVKALNEISDNSIDFLYTLNVLEHIEDDFETVREIYNKVKRGGGYWFTYQLSKFYIAAWIKKLVILGDIL